MNTLRHSSAVVLWLFSAEYDLLHQWDSLFHLQEDQFAILLSHQSQLAIWFLLYLQLFYDARRDMYMCTLWFMAVENWRSVSDNFYVLRESVRSDERNMISCECDAHERGHASKRKTISCYSYSSRSSLMWIYGHLRENGDQMWDRLISICTPSWGIQFPFPRKRIWLPPGHSSCHDH